jgi:MHS family proline/betaine transporter-like MFS transporter
MFSTDTEEQSATVVSRRNGGAARAASAPHLAHDEQRRRRTSAMLGSIGAALEWYDFTLYVYLAPVLAALFFPASDPLDGLLAAYGVFAAGFLMRPLGAVFFGNLGDARGRKTALTYSVVMMSIAMVLIGLLPTHASIGVAAPIALVLLRLVQGFSVGGEASGTYVLMFETARRGRRGLGAALAATMASLGVLLAALAVTIMHAVLNTGQTADHGWRILFFLGAGIGLIALIMRRRMAETTDFAAARDAHELSAVPIKRALRHNRRAIAQVFALSAYTGVVFWLAFSYVPSYLQDPIGTTPEVATLGVTFATILYALAIPFAGLLSDHLGRRAVMAAAAGLTLVLAYPLFTLLDEATVASSIAGQLMLMALVLLYIGPWASAISELFPTATRYTGVAIGYNLAMAIFGGTLPLLATLLIKVTGDNLAPAFYLMGASLLILVVLARFPETYRAEID